VELNRQTNNFIGFDSEYKDAKIVSFGAPFDGTTSFRPSIVRSFPNSSVSKTSTF